MGLFGPAKNNGRGGQASGAPRVKTGGAGNLPIYTPSVIAAASASSRPSSASFRNSIRNGGAQAQAQYRPQSAQRTQPYPAGAQYTSALQPTQQLQASAAAASQRPSSSARWSAADQPPPLEAVDHEEDCICTICSCGKHQCPPTPRETHYDPAISSETRQSYQGVFRPAVRAKAPDRWVARNVPFEGESTAKSDYKAHDVSMMRQALGTRGAIMDTGVGRNSAPFDDTTTHKSDFPAHPLGPRTSVGPREGTLSTTGPDSRDFSTEGRQQYVPHPLQARKSRAPDEVRPSLPFAGTTTAQSDFPAYANARPSIPKFRSTPFQPAPEDRDFATEGRTEFTRKQMVQCPAIPVAGPSKIYPGHVAVELVQPPSTFRRTGLPMGARTTQRF